MTSFLFSIAVFVFLVLLLFFAQRGTVKRRKEREAKLRDSVVLLKAASGIRSGEHVRLVERHR